MEQEKLGHNVSRRRISRIMNENGLVSNYTVAQYKVHTNNCNESSIPNIVDRKFETLEQLQLELAEYIFWYNNLRVHGALGYKTPIEYRELSTMTLERHHRYLIKSMLSKILFKKGLPIQTLL